MEPQRYVPAWQVCQSEDSTGEWVYILTPEIDNLGWPRTKLTHRLTPVDAEEQRRLSAIRPAWLDK